MNSEVKVLIGMGFKLNPECLENPDPDTILARIYGWDLVIEYQSVCLWKAGLWLSFSPSEALDYDEFVQQIRTRLGNSKKANKAKQLLLF